MPRPPKYPLQPLLEHRDRQVDDATSDLGDAVRAREAAEEAKARAERARRDAEERAAEVRADEASRLAQGELRAVDLARAEAWEVRARGELADLSRAVDQTDARTHAAATTEGEARAALAQRKADRDVVAKDEVRFVDRARRVAEAKEEDEAEDAQRGAARGKPGER